MPPQLAREHQMGKKPALTTVLPSRTHELFCPCSVVFLQTEACQPGYKDPRSRFLSQDTAFLFSGKETRQAQGFLSLFSFSLKLIFEKGEDGQQGIFLCLATVGVSNGKMGLSQCGKSTAGTELGPFGPKMRAAGYPFRLLAAQIHRTVAISAASLEKAREQRSSQQHEIKQTDINTSYSLVSEACFCQLYLSHP